jgi:peptidoglycan/xylan/chitin deacetylase (PgdA/CDA1 family)
MKAVVESIVRGVGSVTSPGGANAPLTVLLYHRVLNQPDDLSPGEPSAAQFDAQMAILSRIFRVLPLDDALSRLSDGTLPSRALCVTFDDGYLDNIEVALPILRRHGLNATFFIASGLIDGGRMMHDTVIETVRRLPAQAVDLRWMGLGTRTVGDVGARLALIDEIVRKVKYLPFAERSETCRRLAAMVGDRLPGDLMMSSEDIRALHRAGMRIGAHTHEHPILSKLSPSEAKAQIVKSRQVLSDIVGSAPSMFAYPNGKPGLDYTAEHVAMVKEAGFTSAVSVAFGTASRTSDHHQIPRFCPWDRDPKRLVMRLVRHPLRRKAAAHV